MRTDIRVRASKISLTAAASLIILQAVLVMCHRTATSSLFVLTRTGQRCKAARWSKFYCVG